MNPLRRLDGNLAELAALMCKGMKLTKKAGGDFSASDLMRWGAPPPETDVTLEEAFAVIKSARIN